MALRYLKSFLSIIKCVSKDDEFSSLLDNPYASEEEKASIKQEINNQEHQPGIPFSRLASVYSNNNDEKWDGLKFCLNFKPNQLFSMDYSTIIEKGKSIFKNIQTGCMCFIPTNQSNGIMFVGRKDPPSSLVLQSHFILSNTDKIAVIAQYPKDDMSQALYSAEYSHDFDRVNAALKCSTVDPFSVSAITSIYRNVFLGIEAYKIPEEFNLGYNYSFWLKSGTRNPLGISFNYLTTLPGLMCDITYRFNNSFNIFLSGSYSWNPMIVQLGSTPSSGKISSTYTNDYFEINAETNLKGDFHILTTVNLIKNINLQMNLGLNVRNKLTKKSIKNFGLGLKVSTTPLEEGLQQIIAHSADDNIQEYEYDKLSKKL